MVVPEGAAGLSIIFRSFLFVEFSFTLNYYVVRLGMLTVSFNRLIRVE